MPGSRLGNGADGTNLVKMHLPLTSSLLHTKVETCTFNIQS